MTENMVNYEIKGMLAKLLATEDIVVEHKKVETACFNVQTRVLTLPMWKASNTVVDLLCAHEVGHARETPNVDWTKDYKVPPQYVNIVEDVRVEKLMKRRYPGLAKTFYNGYKELQEDDFFSIGNDDITTYSFPDRINLHFKIGNFISVEFSSQEKEIVQKVDSCETFDDVLRVSEELYQYCKNLDKQQKVDDIDVNSTETSTGSSSSTSDFKDQPEGDNEQESEQNENNKTKESPMGTDENQNSNPEKSNEIKSAGEHSNNTEVKTMKSLEDAIKNLVDNDAQETTYIEIPNIDLSQVIIDNSIVHKLCDDAWKLNEDDEQNFDGVDREYFEFKKSSQKEVNYLVKEFECRKSADSYARATTSRTGILDCSKLHTYKYNEDIFRKVTTLANGKNHGLIFILDWSGSMQEVLLDTVKQLFNLIWFCKKVSIPFDVYAFTNEFPRSFVTSDNRKIVRGLSYEKKVGTFAIDEWFSLMNILTSKVNLKTLEKQMLNIYRISQYYNNGYGRYNTDKFKVPMGWGLSGTPLNETLLCLHKILPKFQKEHKLQKVQCVILTDGEGGTLKYHKKTYVRSDMDYIGTNSINPFTSFLRDRKTGNVYSLTEICKLTDILLQNLRDNFPSVNFIGMRILNSRDVGYFMRNYYTYNDSEYVELQNRWKKEKTFAIKKSGYHIYFGLSASELSNSTEFNVSESASKTEIKAAFAKSLKSKKMNKKILSEFMDLIA